jgi:hypothetical protein
VSSKSKRERKTVRLREHEHSAETCQITYEQSSAIAIGRAAAARVVSEQ